MTSVSSSFSSDDEIDLREVASALRRRWIWVASGGLLGVVIAGISILTHSNGETLGSIKMVVDASQGPCIWTKRKFQKFEEPEVSRIDCEGEFLATRRDLDTIASDEFGSDELFLVRVRPLKFGTAKDNNLVVSDTQIELVVESSLSKLDGVKARLENIKNVFAAKQLDNVRMLSSDASAGKDWISIGQVSAMDKVSYKPMPLGLLGGLVVGSGAALIADRRSNRVFSHLKILGQLGYPLWLTVPRLPWSDQVTGPLIGQLGARLDRSIEWRVLSIAHEHELVAPLAQALTRQSEPELSCKSVEPLLNSIIRPGSNSRPIGLLLVVESGFNSSKALEDARLLLSQLSCVQSIGVVLAGVPLPSELTV